MTATRATTATTQASTPPDTSEAHQFVTRWLPYLRGAARRAAPRIGIDPEDLVNDFVAHLLENFGCYLEVRDRVEAGAFVVIRIKRVLGEQRFVRWRKFYHHSERLAAPHIRTDDVDDPAAVAELVDEVEAVRRALVKLGSQYPRRREAVELRMGLRGVDPVAGKELGRAMGTRATTANETVLAGLRYLAELMGSDDPRAARVSQGEGISLGQKAKGRGRGRGAERLAAAVA